MVIGDFSNRINSFSNDLATPAPPHPHLVSPPLGHRLDYTGQLGETFVVTIIKKTFSRSAVTLKHAARIL